MTARTGAAAGHIGYFHEAAPYASDDELVDIVVPFLRDGAEAGEPTLVALTDANAAIVGAALGGSRAGVTFLPGATQFDRPASVMRSYRNILTELLVAGPAQVRVVGNIPYAEAGTPWHRWARYEAAANLAYADLPVWGLCPYDVRLAPAAVLEDVACTHPYVATAGGGHHHNARYEEPAGFLASRPDPPPDPQQGTAPDVALVDPRPGDARRAVSAALDAAAGFDAERRDGVALVVSELVSNAHAHGRPPVAVEAWVRPGRVVLEVTDTGAGPTDPFVGLAPAPGDRGAGGLGLWLAEQLCDDVVLAATARGFTVRVAVGWPISS